MFRIENEHCTNVRLARATSEKPLPFSRVHHHEEASEPAESGRDEESGGQSQATAQGQDSESREQKRQKPRTLREVGLAMMAAHATDYQRKRTTGGNSDRVEEDFEEDEDEVDEDEDADDDEVLRD